MTGTYRKFDQYRSNNKFAVIFDDFGDYLASTWQATGGGSQTVAIDADYNGGGVLLTTATSGTNNVNLQKGDGAGSTGKATPFIPLRGKKFSFVARLGLVSPTPFTGGWGAGVYPSAASPLAGTGVGIEVDKAGVVTLRAFSNSVTAAYVAPRADSPVFDVEAYYDGGDAVMFFINGERIGKVELPTTVPSTALSPTVGVINDDTAAAHAIVVDYIGLAIER